MNDIFLQGYLYFHQMLDDQLWRDDAKDHDESNKNKPRHDRVHRQVVDEKKQTDKQGENEPRQKQLRHDVHVVFDSLRLVLPVELWMQSVDQDRDLVDKHR